MYRTVCELWWSQVRTVALKGVWPTENATLWKDEHKTGEASG